MEKIDLASVNVLAEVLRHTPSTVPNNSTTNNGSPSESDSSAHEDPLLAIFQVRPIVLDFRTLSVLFISL